MNHSFSYFLYQPYEQLEQYSSNSDPELRLSVLRILTAGKTDKFFESKQLRLIYLILSKNCSSDHFDFRQKMSLRYDLMLHIYLTERLCLFKVIN